MFRSPCARDPLVSPECELLWELGGCRGVVSRPQVYGWVASSFMSGPVLSHDPTGVTGGAPSDRAFTEALMVRVFQNPERTDLEGLRVRCEGDLRGCRGPRANRMLRVFVNVTRKTARVLCDEGEGGANERRGRAPASLAASTHMTTVPSRDSGPSNDLPASST